MHLFGDFSETVVMDFSSNSNGIKITTQLTNIVFEGKTVIPFAHKDIFTIDNCCIVNERMFEKDDIIPVSMEKLNLIILSIKKDVQEFISQSAAYILKKSRKNNEIISKNLFENIE